MKPDFCVPEPRASSPAPETNHALACVVDEAKRPRKKARKKSFFSIGAGTAVIDLGAYDKYLSANLTRL